jgi:hypothetical protein
MVFEYPVWRPPGSAGDGIDTAELHESRLTGCRFKWPSKPALSVMHCAAMTRQKSASHSSAISKMKCRPMTSDISASGTAAHRDVPSRSSPHRGLVSGAIVRRSRVLRPLSSASHPPSLAGRSISCRRKRQGDFSGDHSYRWPRPRPHRLVACVFVTSCRQF